MSETAAATVKRPAWLAVTALLVTGLAGMALGVALDRRVLLGGQSFAAQIPLPPPGVDPSPAVRHLFVLRLARELDLTDAQRQQVEALIEKESPRVRAAADTVRAMFERAMKEPRAELMAILTPEQQRKFLAMLPADVRGQ